MLATYGQDRPGSRPLWLGSVTSSLEAELSARRVLAAGVTPDAVAGHSQGEIAAVNGPAVTVVSGDPAAVRDLVAACEAAGSGHGSCRSATPPTARRSTSSRARSCGCLRVSPPSRVRCQ